MADSYPIMLHLEGRLCVVVGGGTVAARKATGLLAAGAVVTVISPELNSELKRMADDMQIHVVNSQYQSGLLTGLKPILVFAATDDPTVNQRIVEDSRSLGALVNRADHRDEGDFENLAAFQRGTITVAVSTGGASPALAKHLSGRLEAEIGDEYVILAGWMNEQRHAIQTTVTSQVARAALWKKVIDSSILDYLRQGDMSTASELFQAFMVEAKEEG